MGPIELSLDKDLSSMDGASMDNGAPPSIEPSMPIAPTTANSAPGHTIPVTRTKRARGRFGRTCQVVAGSWSKKNKKEEQPKI